MCLSAAVAQTAPALVAAAAAARLAFQPPAKKHATHAKILGGHPQKAKLKTNK